MLQLVRLPSSDGNGQFELPSLRLSLQSRQPLSYSFLKDWVFVALACCLRLTKMSDEADYLLLLTVEPHKSHLTQIHGLMT
jgi:hypothetical protein